MKTLLGKYPHPFGLFFGSLNYLNGSSISLGFLSSDRVRFDGDGEFKDGLFVYPFLVCFFSGKFVFDSELDKIRLMFFFFC